MSWMTTRTVSTRRFAFARSSKISRTSIMVKVQLKRAQGRMKPGDRDCRTLMSRSSHSKQRPRPVPRWLGVDGVA